MRLMLFGTAGRRVLVFPTLNGNQDQYEELGLVEVLRGRLEAGSLQLLCLDSLDRDSWYNREIAPRDRVLRHVQFETYVLQEVLPFFASHNSDQSMTAHGCSLGAFHAMNIALRHPQYFTHVLALGGRYDLTRTFMGLPNLVDRYYDDDVYFNTPAHFLEGITDPGLLEQLRRLDITIVVGESDDYREHNQEFSEALSQKGIGHSFHIWPGYSHGAHNWREMVRRYLL